MAEITASKKARYLEKTGENTYEEKYFTTIVEQIKAEAAIAGQVAGASLSTILTSIYNLAKNSGVTSVTVGSGSKETGDVTITLAKLGTVAITQDQVNQINTNKSNITKAQNRADAAYSLAQGRSRGVSFETVDSMKEALKSASNSEYKVGDQLFIKATNVPDYWISGILSTNTGETGYYEIAELETQKVDLSNYATKEEVAAVQEEAEAAQTAANQAQSTADTAKSTANTANSTATANKTSITNITNGTTAVGKANQLTNSRNIKLTGDATGSAAFNGSADASINVTLSNTGVAAGVYSAVQVDAKGRVLKGQQMVAFATSMSDTTLNNLAIGGIAIVDA